MLEKIERVKEIRMNRKTFEAVQNSLIKWRAIADTTQTRFLRTDEKEYPGTGNCPLCEIYIPDQDNMRSSEVCVGCPVSEINGISSCIDTPYQSFGYAKKSSNHKYQHDAASEFVQVFENMIDKSRVSKNGKTKVIWLKKETDDAE